MTDTQEPVADVLTEATAEMLVARAIGESLGQTHFATKRYLTQARAAIRAWTLATDSAYPPLRKICITSGCLATAREHSERCDDHAPQVAALPEPAVSREALTKWFRSRMSPPFAAPETLAQEGFIDRWNARADKSAQDDADALLASNILGTRTGEGK